MKIFTDAFLQSFSPLSVIIIKYGRLSKTSQNKGVKVRKGTEIRKQPQKGPLGAKNEKKRHTKGKEGKASKATVNKKANIKGRPSFQSIHKKSGQEMRAMRKYKKLNKRTPRQERKTKRKMG